VDEARAPFLALGVGAALAGVGLILAAATGGPYLTGDAVNGWIVAFAVGLLTLMLAIPFAIERRLRPRIGDGDRRWERALLAWGAISVVALLAGLLLGVGAGWDGDSLAGAAGLLITIESALVCATMAVWLLSG
jgi:hypothetical protein